MSKDYQDVISMLEKEGFPFERKVRRELFNQGIENVQSRYLIQKEGIELSKDIDILGKIHFKTYKPQKGELRPNLSLRIIGEVKKLYGTKICFYELDNEKPENFLFRFPNLLNNCFNFKAYGGGDMVLSSFISLFGKIPISKALTCLIPNNNKSKYDSKGNALIYETSNELALACEYWHKQECLFFRDDLKIHACFPVIFTEAELLKITGVKHLKAHKINLFIYLVACSDIDKVPITTKDKYYLPILIVNQSGIKKSIKLIKKISEVLCKDMEDLIKNEDSLKREYEDYKKICGSIVNKRISNL